jgi:hypothetical protein
MYFAFEFSSEYIMSITGKKQLLLRFKYLNHETNFLEFLLIWALTNDLADLNDICRCHKGVGKREFETTNYYRIENNIELTY